MINFIIYDKDEEITKDYTTIISKYMMDKEDKYKIIYINQYDKKVPKMINNIDGKKIYIIDINMPHKSGLAFAKEIRDNNDWISPIIVCSKEMEFKNDTSGKRLLMLDYIDKKQNITENLLISLDVAYNIVCSDKSYNFKYTGEYYQVPYKSILYFEKNTNDNYSTLITKNAKYTVKNSITSIMKELNDDRFILCSRSCIVNIDNISSIDFSNNIIKFGKVSTNLMSREGKKNLKDVIEL